MSGSGIVGAVVDTLHSVGRNIARRSGGGGPAARRLSTTLESSASAVGHPRVRGSITAYVTNNVVDTANLFGSQLTAAGDNVSNVASTIRNEDTEGGYVLQTEVAANSAISDRIHGNVPV
ncbi:hypothetical protein GCM10009821_28180 [Aeromicrobium halocynthiae]|uniref:Uncharacterized protein n=1 Tax=Aeromicrobium halocynthiae TaxID=560557 RepID=A0ABN2W6K1_9ACTN